MKMPVPSQEFKPLSAGTHLGVCHEVIDFGTQEDTYEGKTNIRRKIWLGWEIPAEQMSDGRNFQIGKEYTFSSSEKSTFRKHLEAWRGKAFDDADFGPDGSFDVENLLGAGCMLSINHNSNGRAVVGGVMKLPAGTTSPEYQRAPRHLDLDAESLNTDVFQSLSDWMQERIRSSPEYQKLAGEPALAAAEGDEAPF